MFIAFVRRNERSLVLVGLLLVVFTVALDMFVDLRDGLSWGHLLHEILILVFCLAVTLFQVGVIARQKRVLALHEKEIVALTESREEFRRRSMRFSQDFSQAVTDQFAQWQLTESESDVAVLLIQGLSMKEIAENRNSKETTVRQQAASVYRKAKLEGRQELTAFFLEDLFSPRAE